MAVHAPADLIRQSASDVPSADAKESNILDEQLLEMSRRAGMAEVATGVLHNVGNALNSVNVSTILLADRTRQSKVKNLARACELLRAHQGDLGTYLSSDPAGRELPEYLIGLAEYLVREREESLHELQLLRSHIDHIKEIIEMQQDYARLSGVAEDLEVASLVEDALHLNAGALRRHEIHVVRTFQTVPRVMVEKHRVLQILSNLLSNAKYAMEDRDPAARRLDLRIALKDAQTVAIEVEDNGCGIPAENLTRIFTHGFTTKPDGHGFGLHNASLAARHIGGALHVASAGPGTGARFTLEVPVKPAKARE